ncbi:MAG TPA: DUF1080 domain-containing protein, partial [Vicinamibacterales bacterium]|nr:DUF1080 domain-containing protein [Vicinamibacterales bacterium]
MSTKFTLLAASLAAVTALAPLAAQGPAAGAKTPTANGTKTASGAWTPLFDGKSLAGWRGYKKENASETRWKVENGMLTLPADDGKDTRGARDIITVDTYDNFDLRWEWKAAPGANSGVKYFVLEDQPAAIGHEYQIIDDERHADAKIGPHRQTAALYDVFPAADRPIKPAGEWNVSEVRAHGNHVEHWLNGKKVLEYELNSPKLKDAIAKSKFKDIARFGTPVKGHILLQDHGNQVWYRKV